MSIHNKINGVWRNVWSSHVRINGVWRDVNGFVKIDGIWRETYRNAIEPEDVLGFHMVYTFSENKTHPDHPSLKATHDLPVTFNLTGEHIGSMDYSTKGVVLDYVHEYPYKEGIVAYDGHLYAELLDGTYVDLGLTKVPGESDDRIRDPIGINESWSTSKVSNLDITITGYTFHECHGFYTAGWNNLFSTEDNIIDISELHGDPDSSIIRLEKYSILPLSSRDTNFSPMACIGIARDMHTVNKNMVGSYGRLDHTISHIFMNGIEKPFVIEYYG